MHASPELSVYVSFLFTGLLTHGSLPIRIWSQVR
jgi:hypothetical protein